MAPLISFLRLCFLSLLALFSLHSLLGIARLSWMQLHHPILHHDSWIFTHRPALLEWPNFIRWLVEPYGFHRVVLQKAVTVIETEVFRIPPATTGIAQSLLLVLLSSGIIALVLGRIATGSPGFVLWLTATGILVNHWQAENFWWEFQTPWLFVNMLTLLSTLTLLNVAERRNRKCRRIEIVCLALLPWLAIYSCGQGIALAAALVLAAFFVSRKLALIIASSAGLALTFSCIVLPYFYVDLGEGPFGFNLRFFMILLTGGLWRGMAALALGLLLLLALQTRTMLKQHRGFFQKKSGVFAALLLPGMYAVCFALITTLARSPQGIGSAFHSRYVTPLLMLPISGILLLAWMNPVERGSPLRQELLSLIPAALFLIAMILPQSQALGADNFGNSRSWHDVLAHRKMLEQGFRCTAFQARQLRSAFRSEPIRSAIQAKRLRTVFEVKHLLDEQGLASSCNTMDGASDEGIKYLIGMKPLQPLGWHRRLVADPSS